MAATQYQIFCRYLNENVNRVVSNTSAVEWVSAEEWYECKMAYNITNTSQTNALKTTQVSVHTNLPEGTLYRNLYDAICHQMETLGPNGRLRYENLSIEEQHVYDLCNRYKEIIKGIGDGKVVTEYAMIRPLDQMGYTWNTNSQNAQREQQQQIAALKKAVKKMDAELHDVIYDQLKNDNEKYNMLFTYAGIAQTDEQVGYYQLGNNLERQSELGMAGPSIECLNPYVPGNTNNIASAQVSGVSDIVDAIPNAVYERMERLKMDPWFLIATCNSLKAAMTKAEQLIDIYGKDAVKIGKIVPLDQYIEIV